MFDLEGWDKKALMWVALANGSAPELCYLADRYHPDALPGWSGLAGALEAAPELAALCSCETRRGVVIQSEEVMYLILHSPAGRWLVMAFEMRI